jgi:SAM-dependent methyltransferase
MRDWALKILNCPRCASPSLRLQSDAVSCPSCGARYAFQDDVTDFLIDANPVVVRERDAVAALDKESTNSHHRLRHLLQLMDEGRLAESDRREFPCLQHAVDSRAQVQELLAEHPLTAGDTVVELGADHCWTSSLLLDAGCRVIAVDITDHLRLAARGADPHLCRINADMNRLPLSHGVADVVWATASAHHSWNLKTTFLEAARVLRNEGRLVFCCEPLPSWPRYFFGKDFGKAEKKLGINETWTPRSTWLRLCTDAGFSPQLLFPTVSLNVIEEKLKKRHIPTALSPLVKPFLQSLQVSIHLLASKA